MQCLIQRGTSKRSTPDASDVIISTAIKRFDNASASEIVDHISRKLLSFGFSVIYIQDVSRKAVGRQGLHLNEGGNTKFARNVAA